MQAKTYEDKINRETQRVVVAMNRTPFAAGIGVDLDIEKPIDAEKVAVWIERLAVRLADHARDFNVLEEEVRELRSQRAALRRLIGTEV